MDQTNSKLETKLLKDFDFKKLLLDLPHVFGKIWKQSWVSFTNAISGIPTNWAASWYLTKFI